jgi:SET domain-containing protein
MTFHEGLIIDATKGSVCRFVNHSCEPNCHVEKWVVNGEPRMALFANEEGIKVGEELTYDYNFA